MESDECLVPHRQEVFCNTMTSHFLYKVRRYRKLLQKDGVIMDSESSNPSLTHRTMSVEEELQLVVGRHRPSSAASLRRNFQKAGKRISAASLFRWLYRIVQRNKAATILQHLDRVPEEDMLATIEGVAREISVAYEYQLVMLYGEGEVIQLGQHVVSCVMVYLNNRDASFTTDGLLHAVLEVKLQSSRHKDFVRTRTIIYQGRELCLRWRLGQVLKQPGLRAAPGDLVVDDNGDITQSVAVKSEHELDTVEQSTKTGILSEIQNRDAASSHVPGMIGNRELNFNSGDSVEAEHCIHIEDTSKIKYTDNKVCVEDKAIVASNMEYNSITSNGTAIEDTQQMKDEHKKSHAIGTDLVDGVPPEITNEVPEDDTTTRRISVFDMDYENGQMFVTEVDVSARDFSPVDDTSQVSDCTLEENGDAITEATDDKLMNGKHGDTLYMHGNDIEFDNMTNEILKIKPFIIDKGNDLPLEKHSKTHTCGIGMTGDSKFDLVLNDVKCIAYQESRSQSLTSANVSNCDIGVKTSPSGTFVCSSVTRSQSWTTANISNCELRGAETSPSVTYVSSSVTRDCSITPDSSSRLPGDTMAAEHIYNVSHQGNNDTTILNTINGESAAATRSPERRNLTRQVNTTQKLSENELDDIVTVKDSKDIAKYSTHGNIGNGSGQTNVRSIRDTSSSSVQDHIKYKYFGCFTPYGARCRPCVYGFRGPLHVWDEDKKIYTLIYNDRVSLDASHRREIGRRADNPHQAYIPISYCDHQPLNLSV